MEKIRLKGTSFVVNQLGFGGLPLKNLLSENGRELLRACLNKGINFFGTSRAYGKSEKLIGDVVGNKENCIICTKTKNFENYDKAVKDFYTSLNSLKREYIDIYMLHQVNNKEQLRRIEENGFMSFLLDQVKAGRIKKIGFSTHHPQIIRPEEPLFYNFSVFMLPFNFVEEENLDFVNYLDEKGYGTIIMKPFGGGVFKNKKLSLQYTFRKAKNSVIIPGIKEITELEENLESIKGIHNEFKLVNFIELYKEKAEIGNKFCRRCDYCDVCPQGIAPGWVIQLRNLLEKRGDINTIKSKHINMIKDAFECKKCGKCEKECPYDLPLTELVLKEAEETWEYLRREGIV